jgi:hypothetical protein
MTALDETADGAAPPIPTAPPDPSVPGGFVARTLSSFRSRNFRLFFIGQTVSNSGNWLTIVALTLLVLHRTDSGLAVGILAACQYGPILLLSAWAGAVIDRHDKRSVLFVTQGLEMAQSFVLAALAFSHDAPLLAFYATAALGGCLLAFDNPVRRTFVNEMVPVEDIPNAVTLYSAMVNISRIVGPALAGVLIVTVGYGWCFTLDAVSYVTVLVALAMMRTSELRRVVAAPAGRGQVRAGVRYIAAIPELWIPFGMLLVVGTLSYNFSVAFPLFVEKGLGGGDGRDTGGGGRRRQRGLHDGDDRHRPAAHRPADARPGSGHPDGPAHRHHPDRRPDPRRPGRHGGRPRPGPGRRHRRPDRRGPGPRRGAPLRGRAAVARGCAVIPPTVSAPRAARD